MAGSPPVAERISRPSISSTNGRFLVPAIVVLDRHVVPVAAPRAPGLRSPFFSRMALVVAALLFRRGGGARSAGSSAFSRPEFVKPAFVKLNRRMGVFRSARRRDVPNLHCAIMIPAGDRRAAAGPSARPYWSRSSGALCSSWPACTGSGWPASAASARRRWWRRQFVPHVRSASEIPWNRRPANGGVTDTFQVDTARESFIRRLVRQGSGRRHAQAHPARQPHRLHLCVTGEEFGSRLHRAGVAVRLHRHPRSVNGQTRIRFVSHCGRLVMLFGIQSCINMAVNLRLCRQRA